MNLKPLLPLLDEPHGQGPHPSRPCPICTIRWVPWQGSRLPCHARCLYSKDDQDFLYEIAMVSGMNEKQLAAKLGVTTSILRATLAASGRRRKGRR